MTTRSTVLVPVARVSRASAVVVSAVAIGAVAIVGAAVLGATPAVPPAASAATPAASAAATRAKVKADWTAFFAGKTSSARKIALLENGQKFAAVLRGQAATGEGVSASVSKVTLVSSKKANVRYTIDLGGKPVLANQLGQSVLQGGTWKVGVKSFCALLALEQVKTPACPAKA